MVSRGEKAGRKLARANESTQDNSANLGPSKKTRVLSVFRAKRVTVTDNLFASKNFYCDDTFVFGHPTKSVLDDTNYRFDEGYCESEIVLEKGANTFLSLQNSGVENNAYTPSGDYLIL